MDNLKRVYDENGEITNDGRQLLQEVGAVAEKLVLIAQKHGVMLHEAKALCVSEVDAEFLVAGMKADWERRKKERENADNQ